MWPYHALITSGTTYANALCQALSATDRLRSPGPHSGVPTCHCSLVWSMRLRFGGTFSGPWHPSTVIASGRCVLQATTFPPPRFPQFRPYPGAPAPSAPCPWAVALSLTHALPNHPIPPPPRALHRASGAPRT